MATQEVPSELTDSVRSFVVPPDFSIREIDGHRSGVQDGSLHIQNPVSRRVVTTIPVVPPPPKLTAHPNDDPTLGPVLGKFVGTFQGAGMNTIFRPRNGFESLTEDNLLEVNLTVETLQFMESSVLNKVPNRGFDDQEDIELTGIPYQQTVSDQLNPKTGKADLGATKVDLHFEQGLFMRTPTTGSKDPNGPNRPTGPTISRMGSIPHGTTINAQDLEPETIKSGMPDIPDIKITPFFIGKTQEDGAVPQSKFDNMNALGDVQTAAKQDLRKPRNLTDFNTNKTITIESLNNPNLFLKNHNTSKDIAEHWALTVQTKHPTLKGGGVANIAFLVDGEKPTAQGSARGNANAVNMECTYWVSTVRHDVLIKAGDYTHKDPVLFPVDDTRDGVPSPRFQVQLRRKTTQDNVIKVTSTQIQYSQNVTLDFGVLSWPHVSVATLVPALPVLVAADSPALANVQ